MRAAAIVFALALVACGGTMPSVTVRGPQLPPAKSCGEIGGTSPLVTEWPASEKAHLQALLAEGAVAVVYSGCQMTLLDRCKIAGKYELAKRASPETESFDIADEEQLYAKLPLGAVKLEAELRRSGKLAVQTTTAAGFEGRGIDPSRVPVDGACARATHVITRVDVGAFRIVSGGGALVRGEVSSAVAGASGSSQMSSDIVREAGDPASCATADATQCSSPIRVHLTSIYRPDEGVVEPNVAPPADAVRVTFVPESPDQRWTLRTSAGRVLCDLPCTRWVRPSSGWQLVLDSDDPELQRKKVAVPDRLAAAAGASERAVPLADYQWGNRWAMLFGAAAFTGAGVYFAVKTGWSEPALQVLLDAMFFPLGIACTVVLLNVRPASLQERPEGTSAAEWHFTPTGIAGSF